MVTTPDLLAAGPEIFLAVMGMVLMMIGVFSPEKRALGIVSGLTVASFAVVLAYYLFMASSERLVAFAGLFVTDAFAIFMKALVLLGGILVLQLDVALDDDEEGVCRRVSRAEQYFAVLVVDEPRRALEASQLNL